MVLVTYQKRNGEVFDRVMTTSPSYKIGATIPIGWKVLNIMYRYKGKYYNRYDYDKIIDARYRRDKKIHELKKVFPYYFKSFIVFGILMLIFKIIFS